MITRIQTRVDFRVEMNELILKGSKALVCHRQMRKQGTKVESRNSSRYVRKQRQTEGEIFGEDRQHRLFIQPEDYRVRILSRFRPNERTRTNANEQLA